MGEFLVLTEILTSNISIMLIGKLKFLNKNDYHLSTFKRLTYNAFLLMMIGLHPTKALKKKKKSNEEKNLVFSINLKKYKTIVSKLICTLISLTNSSSAGTFGS